jgi:hypothetical protein
MVPEMTSGNVQSIGKSVVLPLEVPVLQAPVMGLQGGPEDVAP